MSVHAKKLQPMEAVAQHVKRIDSEETLENETTPQLRPMLLGATTLPHMRDVESFEPLGELEVPFAAVGGLSKAWTLQASDSRQPSRQGESGLSTCNLFVQEAWCDSQESSQEVPPATPSLRPVWVPLSRPFI